MEIDYQHQQILLQLTEQFPQLTEQIKPLLQTEKWSQDKRHLLINLLVQQLLNGDSFSSRFFEELERLFPRYFIAFIDRLYTAVNSSNKIINQISIQQRFLVLLAQIVEDYPSLHRITEDHLRSSDTSLIEWNDESPKKKLKTSGRSMNNRLTDEISLLMATLRLLLVPNSTITQMQSWKWKTLVHLLENHHDENVKWLAFLCLSIVWNMTVDQQNIYRPNVSNQTIFNVFDLIHRRNPVVQHRLSFDHLFIDEDFKKRTIFLSGISLFKSAHSSSSNIQMTLTPTIEKSLREIALSINLSWTTFIFSPISNGKTTIVEYIAQQIGKRLIKIQCSDHMDSKILLGTYQCTDKPGEFVWTPGLLVEATSEGHWLLMEDIDAANSDVLSTIKSLIETKSIGHGRISPDFRLFLTQRDTGVPVQSNELLHLLKSVFCVVIPAYTDDEIIQIMENLPIWNDDLQLFQMKLFQLYQSFQNIKGSIHTRLVTLRDLLKCCRRLSTLSISTSIHRQLAFSDLIDCFAAFLVKENRLSVIQTIGTLFNMNNQEAEFHAFKSFPEFDEHDKQYFIIGHVKLEIQKKSQSIQQQYCFAKTRTAMYTLERIARCVQMNEPVLLCGETGCGKTTLVQYLAQKTGNRLHVVNLSQQSDAVDLLGGYKPFDPLLLLKQIYRDFSHEQTNDQYIEEVQKSIQAKRYKEAVRLMIKYTDQDSILRVQLTKLRQSFKSKSKSALIFRFVEGSLVQALRNGDWILLDEINLASSETLQLLSGILESDQGTIWLTERGDKQPIVRNENFRLFGCMNPASDVGKRDIPTGIRNRFTEFFVDECDDRSEYSIIVEKYLQQTNIPKEYIDRIVTFFMEIQTKVKNFLLTSSSKSNNRIAVTYSLRTLCRALRYIATTQWSGKTYHRALFEGFCLSFFSQLNRSYYHDVQKLIHQIILKEKSSIDNLLKTTQMILPIEHSKKYIELKHYFILKGDQPPTQNESYIFTETVTENLQNIIRVLSAKSYPILLQGETSVGKTSLIHWLASATGNQCLRINNHEHTDLSEYLGTYTCSSTTGQLVFQDGPLIKAMRYGWWIILDELNLASSEILEALNRLLDDNRQLFLSETNELVNAHERFQLFATQNPAGEQYAGRKRLSRAFRNRFIELHFDNLPQHELEIIIEKKCQLPKSYSKLLIQTMNDLQKYRSQKGIFFGKSSLITLRDLFRWAQRYTQYKDSSDNYKQFLAEHGYLLLAGRSRNVEDRKFIKEILEKYFCEKNNRIDEDILFGNEGSPFSTRQIWKQIKENNQLKHIVWTQPLRRFAILCALSLQFDEPVLLVGETGCGKTTICEILAKINQQKLFTINCHTTTESADFLGSIRPIRQHDGQENHGLFQWQDGVLVSAMKEGGIFLIDEISLADDSVLERLNSVLEPEKQLVLAEKGYQEDEEQIDMVQANERFRLVATMNPGGDFGKKELSPALRNRFTEIWCTPSESMEDFHAIVVHNLTISDSNEKEICAKMMCDFLEYLRSIITTKRVLITVRDLLSWISFINLNPHNWRYSYEHGAYLVFIDAMDSTTSIKQSTVDFVNNQQENKFSIDLSININDDCLTFGGYSIPRGSMVDQNSEEYSFQAPTILSNIQRLFRAMQLSNKPILIEGSPGVGKTSLVMALAKLAGYSFVRINLSEQTDISDLFGSDLPDVQSGRAGQFKWHDGPLLTAIKNNQWIILDELNLANQSVLEGLNACLDHRGEIYIPELNRTFHIHDKENEIPLRIFACQNPYGQVSGRKGLPKSFLNRFTMIYFSLLNRLDMKIICQQLHPRISDETIDQMLKFNAKLQEEFQGEPWDFNLRDLLKWCEMFDKNEAFHLIYLKRMRNLKDQERIQKIYHDTTEWKIESIPIDFQITSNLLRIGSTEWTRKALRLPSLSFTHPLLLLRHQLDPLNSILKCLSLSWPILLVGSSSHSSKSTLIHLLSSLVGHLCQTFQMNSSIDTNELLGNYEQFHFQQYAKFHLDLLKEKYSIEQIDYQNQEITTDYLNSLKKFFPIDEIDRLISKSSNEQHFVWIESILLRSMRQGSWLILENVNTCSLSVLDRLNSLLEPHGELIINEGGGEGSRIKPHRDFRLILTMDPRQGHGEISRAMRNRCCEIYIDDQQRNSYDLKELTQISRIEQEDFLQIHQILCEKFPNFGYENLIRSCLLYNELSRSFLHPFSMAIKSAYRTLNSQLNQKIDLLIDQFIPQENPSDFLGCPTRISDLCLQPELTLCEKRNFPLWFCSSKTHQRKFHLLFYRFIDHLSSKSLELDYFRLKHPEETHLLDQLPHSSNDLLLRILIEHHVLSNQLPIHPKTKYSDEQLFFDRQFWNSMKDYFLQNSEDLLVDERFSLYRSWRWFVSIIECSSNEIPRRLHLIIAWNYIRKIFLGKKSNDLFSQQIELIDEEYMKIQNEFLRFYQVYQQRNHSFIQTKEEYDYLSRKYQIFQLIDLFHHQQKSEKSLEKSFQYWNNSQTDLDIYFKQLKDNLNDYSSIFDSIEKSWTEFEYNSTEFNRETFFFNTFESIVYYRYQWIDSYLHGKSSSFPFISLTIPFENQINPEEYFCQLISYSFVCPIEGIYKKFLEENSSRSLLFQFNIRSAKIPLGLYEKIAQQGKFWSRFIWLNGSFLQSNRSNIEEFLRKCLMNPSSTNPVVDLIEQSLLEIDSLRPRGQIDPQIYEQILDYYHQKFRSEIEFEYELHQKCHTEYHYSLHQSIHHWEKQMLDILSDIPREKSSIYLRSSNDLYETLVGYLTKQLIEQLCNRTYLLQEIIAKNQRRIYEQWRMNIVEFHRKFILSERFLVYRDVTIPVMKSVFQIVFALDYHFHGQIIQSKGSFFPFGLNRLTFLQIARDLFDQRTSMQQSCSSERFVQYYQLILEYVVVYVQMNEKCSKEVKDLLHEYLETIHFLWSDEQKQLEDDQRTSSSLFRYENSEVESEEDLREYQRLFPQFDSHFIPSDETIDEPIIPTKPTTLSYSLLYEYFSSIINEKKISFADLCSPFFNTLYQFDDHDNHLLNDMIYLASQSHQNLSKYFLDFHKPFDIYHDSKPSMVIECYPMINAIEKRTKDLLISHENHPTLLEINLIVQRLKSFSIENSLIKYLFGFDLLFTKLTYWQQTYASKTLQTTFNDQLELLTATIIQFRRFQFNCSEERLSMIDYDLRQTTINHWWLHLFGLINTEKDAVVLENVLHQFFRKSSLGDFPIRLEMIRTMEKYFHRDFLGKFYEQFESFFNQQIQSIRKPMEKEMKEFFRIQQWKDTNYYALKGSIEKCQKFLFKSMKKYKQSLNQPIEKSLSLYQITFDKFLSKSEDFYRLIQLKLPKNLIQSSLLLPMKLETNSINRLSSAIHSMNTPTTDRKELKQIYTEKRQLLSQLFKKLTSIGLSFRKGLVNLHSRKSFLVQSIQLKFFPLNLIKSSYGMISTKKKKFLIENRGEILEKFTEFFHRIDAEYYRCIYQHEQLRLFAQKNSIDPVIYQRIQGFTEHLMEILFQQKSLLHRFVDQYQEFSRKYSLYSQRDFRYRLKDFDRLSRLTMSLIEQIQSFLLVIQTIPSNSLETVPILDQTPNYTQLTEFKDLKILLEKFVERLKILLEKVNFYSEEMMEYHPVLKEIEQFHSEICLIKQPIRNIMEKLFIDEQRFPQDQFLGELTKNFLQLFEEFSQINLFEQDQQIIPSVNIKPLRRYRNRLLTNLIDLSSSSPQSMWMGHFYNYLNNHVNQFDLPGLMKIIPQSISSKSEILYQDIHLLIEQLLYRFVFYHSCSLKIYLTLNEIFLKLLRDGFQIPPEETKEDEQEKTEGGVSGMGDGTIEKDAKDVSDQIENEDQLDETKVPGQEQQTEDSDQQQNVDEEANGIEVSFDFEAPMEDPTQGENEDENEQEENESENNDENIDDQMGDVNEDDQGETFDEKKWGDEQDQEEEEEDQSKANESEKSSGKDKRQKDGLAAKDDQLDLDEESLDENPQANKQIEDQPPNSTDNDPNNEETPLELPENMDLDGNDQKEENDKPLEEEEQQQEENPQSNNEEPSEMEEEEEGEEEKAEEINPSKHSIPENLPTDEEEQQLEQSALTQDKTTSNIDSKNQPSNPEKPFANAQTFEEEKSKNPQENLGESSTLNTTQTQQLSSNEQTQLTQQLNNNSDKTEQTEKSSNQSNEQRTLSEIASFIDQNIKAAFDIDQNENENNLDELPSLEQINQPHENQIFAHAKNIPKEFPQQKQVLDSATDEQMKNLPTDEHEQTEPMIIDNREEEIQSEKPNKPPPSSSTLQNQPIDPKQSSSSNNPDPSLEPETKEPMSIDKPYISTTTVQHQFEYFVQMKSELTEKIECQLEEWYTHVNEPSNDLNEAEQVWTQLEYLTQPYVFELCEQLRLLLEPTQRTKYSGDYRTGKRLNMKRIIPYIASDFRKDRIWLRRLKPSKRQYQVILAIDDSQSMDNLQVKRLALESLILLGQTLSLLDIGQFGIVSFGESIRMLQKLNENFNHQNGIEILKHLKFDQTKTLLADLMESVTSTFHQEKLPVSHPLSQLLIILSDGRGLTVSGKDRLLKSVRHAMSQNIFIVFVILDNINQEKSTSIFQINEAIFNGDKVEFRSYLESFPFPYYLVIQNLEMLPRALIDVLRQFLELTATNNNNNQ